MLQRKTPPYNSNIAGMQMQLLLLLLLHIVIKLQFFLARLKEKYLLNIVAIEIK